MSAQKFFTLSNGNKIPAISIIGTGTQWYKGGADSPFNKNLVEQIKFALSLPGVTHVDAAENYRTYPELSQALKESTKPRDQIWITDKFSKVIHKTPKDALNDSLKQLGIDYVDLYLLHDPFYSKENPGYDVQQAWKYVEELYKAGLAKNIGVSNFAVEDLKKILEIAEIKPVINQIEYSAFLQNQTPGIYEFAKENNILLEAYAPLGPLSNAAGEQSGEFYDLLSSLSKKYNHDKGLILLRWVYQTGVLPITTSSKQERIETATKVWEFELTNDEVEKLSKLGNEHATVRQYWKPQYDQYN
ncbi:hypothetical protein WICMUC_003583 [Wickerhamomyces mucosus]|uniref:NADP-dependent oxidoreductase domain-containing protein n=1 Tax=Wickerhamomyces mucosus TaxID=1378264 RepID=A0A9P8PLF6_9ASCO|nr:hypothetical protein WICMUC_003583 [Wickerhamomyces mucosus]